MSRKEIANHELVVSFTIGELYRCLYLSMYAAGPGNNAILMCFKAILPNTKQHSLKKEVTLIVVQVALVLCIPFLVLFKPPPLP